MNNYWTEVRSRHLVWEYKTPFCCLNINTVEPLYNEIENPGKKFVK